jgi:membrane associated rhomboid family serine protease
MIPLKDNIKTRRFPAVTVLIIAVNVLVFLADQATKVAIEGQPMMTPYGLYRQVHYVGGLTQFYALIPSRITNQEPGAWITIYTSMFLHANWLHIGGNMLFLWVFGNNVEDVLGRSRFTLFYVACGTAAAVAQILSNPLSNIPTIGASGAIAGVMGAYFILFPNAKILSIVPIFIIGMLMEVPAIIVIGFWAALQFINASWLGSGDMSGGGVAYFAHIGGFVTGVVLILLLGGRKLISWHGQDSYYR